MLVLSRKLGEQICIGSGIQVTVLAIHKGRVRLGLAAPRELPIHRQELCRGTGFASAQGHGTRSNSGR
jgi:carbon storage regulator